MAGTGIGVCVVAPVPMRTLASPAAAALSISCNSGIQLAGRRGCRHRNPWRHHCTNCRGDEGLVSGPAGERPDWWWTGPKPVQGTPGVQPDGTITSLPLPNLATCTRQQVGGKLPVFCAIRRGPCILVSHAYVRVSDARLPQKSLAVCQVVSLLHRNASDT